jgi:hypothetical protein
LAQWPSPVSHKPQFNDFDSELLIPEDLHFALGRRPSLGRILTYGFAVSLAINIPLDVISAFLVKFGLAVNQNMIWKLLWAASADVG